jgi:hypothetical protein
MPAGKEPEFVEAEKYRIERRRAHLECHFLMTIGFVARPSDPNFD